VSETRAGVVDVVTPFERTSSLASWTILRPSARGSASVIFLARRRARAADETEAVSRKMRSEYSLILRISPPGGFRRLAVIPASSIALRGEVA